jgi:alkylhydroperoxidase family enzyme
MSARLAPLDPPYAPDLQAFLDRIMPAGVPPLVLFTTLARDARLFERFRGGGLLDKGHLTLRQREILIGRVTAQCGSEYEWGVHTAFFAERVGISDAMQRSLVLGSGDDPCWSGAERALIRALSDEAWGDLRRHMTEMAVVEIVMLAGFYRTVSYLTNSLRLPLETFAKRFPV